MSQTRHRKSRGRKRICRAQGSPMARSRALPEIEAERRKKRGGGGQLTHPWPDYGIPSYKKGGRDPVRAQGKILNTAICTCCKSVTPERGRKGKGEGPTWAGTSSAFASALRDLRSDGVVKGGEGGNQSAVCRRKSDGGIGTAFLGLKRMARRLVSSRRKKREEKKKGERSL